VRTIIRYIPKHNRQNNPQAPRFLQPTVPYNRVHDTDVLWQCWVMVFACAVSETVAVQAVAQVASMLEMVVMSRVDGVSMRCREARARVLKHLISLRSGASRGVQKSS
jgi:hypothetical protein